MFAKSELCKICSEVSDPRGPCVLLPGETANWVLRSPISVLYSTTKLLIELVIWLVFGPTDICTGVAGSALVRVRVTSGMAPVTVLVVLAYGIPLIVTLALVPPTGGSKARLEVLLATASAPGMPLAWL